LAFCDLETLQCHQQSEQQHWELMQFQADDMQFQADCEESLGLCCLLVYGPVMPV
jgi:hypothetical protein